MKKILVRTTSGRLEEQNNEKIINSLIKEADLPKNIAVNIASETQKELEKMNLEYVSGSLIR